MGKRGSKPKFTDVFCPNQYCKFYGIPGKGNVVGNGTYQIKNRRVRKYICRQCGRVFNDRTDTFFNNLRKDEFIIQLALKMAMRGMSIEGIADVLEVQPVTVCGSGAKIHKTEFIRNPNELLEHLSSKFVTNIKVVHRDV
jgi:transposase-like protein